MMPEQPLDANSMILDTWHYTSEEDNCHAVVPDGCRDIILEQTNDGNVHCFISPLVRTTYTVEIKKGKKLAGFRLAPGTDIQKKALLDYTRVTNIDDLLNGDWLSEFCSIQRSIKEALDCLRSEIASISQAAKQLGVSPRTLQRLVKAETDKSPHFWFSLVRARRCVKLLKNQMDFIDIALASGYSDQAHMTRELKKWFGCTPLHIKASQEIYDEINQIGYD
jgi:AraC-like DNA-binding protein